MEFPLINKKWKKCMKKACIVYPNEYYGGVYSLGCLIIYNLINSKEDWICERRFLNDATDLDKFDLIGFSLQYELDYYNILNILKKNKIKGYTFAGGPCININQNILDGVVDFTVAGDVEDVLFKILDAFGDNFLEKIANLDGVRKGSFAGVSDLDKSYPLYQPIEENINKNFVFGKCFILEIERGCPFKCHFCPMSKLHGLRYRSFENIKKIIDDGIKLNKRDRVVIYSASFTHPKRKEILRYLIERGLSFSVPSLKVEYVDEELLDLIYKGGQKSLTVAPECGEKLRKDIGKYVTDEIFFSFARIARKFRSIKLYFMVGIPGQDKKDLDEMIEFIKRFRNIFNNIYVSFNPFVPKPKTVFENHIFDKKIIKEQINYLRKNLKLRAKYGDPLNSYNEWKLISGKR